MPFGQPKPRMFSTASGACTSQAARAIPPRARTPARPALRAKLRFVRCPTCVLPFCPHKNFSNAHRAFLSTQDSAFRLNVSPVHRSQAMLSTARERLFRGDITGHGGKLPSHASVAPPPSHLTLWDNSQAQTGAINRKFAPLRVSPTRFDQIIGKNGPCHDFPARVPPPTSTHHSGFHAADAASLQSTCLLYTSDAADE